MAAGTRSTVAHSQLMRSILSAGARLEAGGSVDVARIFRVTQIADAEWETRLLV
jgi:hypothetical protein